MQWIKESFTQIRYQTIYKNLYSQKSCWKKKYKETSNYNSSVFYIVSGSGSIENIQYNSGDVLCTHYGVNIIADTDTVIFNADDSPVMIYT